MAALLAEPASGDEIVVATASNFSDTLEALAAPFETETGHRITIATGSTGQIYAQIRRGAPYDVFLAADQYRPQRLAETGHGLGATRVTFAHGRLVLWSRSTGRFEPASANPLHELDYRRLAIANPALAPYGLAAEETLAALDHAPGRRLVMGENIGQTFALAATGNADIALIAHAQWLALPEARKGSAWLVPAALHGAIRQDAILLSRAEHYAPAHQFMAYLISDRARRIIAGAGYDLE